MKTFLVTCETGWRGQWQFSVMADAVYLDKGMVQFLVTGSRVPVAMVAESAFISATEATPAPNTPTP